MSIKICLDTEGCWYVSSRLSSVHSFAPCCMIWGECNTAYVANVLMVVVMVVAVGVYSGGCGGASWGGGGDEDPH